MVKKRASNGRNKNAAATSSPSDAATARDAPQRTRR
ncbi:hypothetical protein LARI1_G003895 [Lachnellula arida]|uniref:Uncharacterized protein n=1 Tax=Lachnellula arida TaxID=1316785 RepID=A0A8T9B705_9HELO|nr:hypothetical protein LARI1_G003895 [Lachnellula arida]